MIEEWRPAPDEYSAVYQVSNFGRVKSLARFRKTKGGGICPVPERVMKAIAVGKENYPAISLQLNGKIKQWNVHSLVMRVFVGPCPVGQEVRHKDGNPLNCRLDNLEYGTHQQNEDDKQRHGSRPSASNKKHGRALLTIEQANEIRRLYKLGGYTQARLAEMFGVYQVTISNIVLHKDYV